MKKFQDSGHLFRLLAVFAAGILLFLLVRSFLIPKTFGQYGHYRGAALGEISARPVSYAGHQVCESCHADIADTKSHGKHAGVNCESCHGPQAKHTEDPVAWKPPLPNTGDLCARCHQQNIAKPVSFPQVNAAEHSGGVPCQTCHLPHSPAITTGGGK